MKASVTLPRLQALAEPLGNTNAWCKKPYPVEFERIKPVGGENTAGNFVESTCSEPGDTEGRGCSSPTCEGRGSPWAIDRKGSAQAYQRLETARPSDRVRICATSRSSRYARKNVTIRTPAVGESPELLTSL